jgi:predicted NBD/HSP70 family sugar kinase
MFAYFDIGGTKTRVVISMDGNSFADPLKFDTPKNYEEGVDLVVEKILSLTNGAPIEAAGGGIAGPVDRDHTMLVRSPNLSEWAGKPLVQDLSTKLSCPVYIRNDSAIVALGEAHHGAGKGDDIMAYITVSTGVGGSRVVHGVLDVGMYGFEPGHQFIDFDKSACPECVSPQAEDYLSGTATAHRFGVKAYEVEDPQVWEDLSRWLAYMLNNTIVHWAPTSVVLGGSMIVGDPAIPVDRVTDHLNEILAIYPEKPAIKKAALEDMGGLYGAMEYVRQQVEKFK